MGTQYGVFEDDECVADDFWSIDDAQAWIVREYVDPKDREELEISEICHDHPEQPRESCDECNADEEDEEESE